MKIGSDDLTIGFSDLGLRPRAELFDFVRKLVPVR
jgi:hypothetical protein